MPRESKSSPRRLDAAERQAKALALRRAHKSLAEIAAELGYADKSGAAYAVRAGLRETMREDADAIRQLEAERLDAMASALWDRALGSTMTAPGAAEPIPADPAIVVVILKIMQRRARLYGLDNAPTRTVPTARDVLTEAEEADRAFDDAPTEGA